MWRSGTAPIVMKPSRAQWLLPVALIIAILAVSTASILIRFAQREASSLAIAALRLLIATAALTPLAVSRHRNELRGMPRNNVLLAALSGLFLAIHFATWITSLAYTTVASSVVLVSTGPIWVALLSPVFLHERLSRAAVLGLGLSILGGIIIASADLCTLNGGLRCEGLGEAVRGRALWGDFLALVGAWAVSGYLIIGRQLRRSVSLIPYVFVVYALAGVALLVTVLLTGGTVLGLSRLTYLWIVLLALVPQLIGHSTYNWALGSLPAAFVAVSTLGEPIGSAILAFLILQETPGPDVLLGGVLILVGIFLVTRGTLSTTREAKAVQIEESSDANSLL